MRRVAVLLGGLGLAGCVTTAPAPMPAALLTSCPQVREEHRTPQTNGQLLDGYLAYRDAYLECWDGLEAIREFTK